MLNCPYVSDNIKTIIWTKELRQPRIISNNYELYSKNLKYSLNVNYSLEVCPVRYSDSGWYSCYVVKKTLYEQNVKYFVYVEVLESDDLESNNSDYLDDFIPDKCKSIPWTTSNVKDTSLKRQIEKKIEEKIFDFPSSIAYKTVQKELESLQVTPRYIKVNESSSFQLQCVYSGPNYLNVKLKWFKNDQELNQRKRYVFVDYTTNNSVLRIIKFSYATTGDSGQYKCIAYINSEEILFLKSEKIFSYININCKLNIFFINININFF